MRFCRRCVFFVYVVCLHCVLFVRVLFVLYVGLHCLCLFVLCGYVCGVVNVVLLFVFFCWSCLLYLHQFLFACCVLLFDVFCAILRARCLGLLLVVVAWY